MESGEDWTYMDTLRPPVYICLRRKTNLVAEYDQPMQLDGRVDKEEWAHVPWSDPFVDMKGPKDESKHLPLTRFKMMYDDDTLYMGAELLEPKIWGTITQKNSALFQENNFEIFFNPDGSRHHYYEVEVNCLNTIWELLLHRPYKDGYSIENPFNLVSLRSAVFVDGVTNSPEIECVRWCIEMSWSLSELQQFNKLRFSQDSMSNDAQYKATAIATPRPPSGLGQTPRPAVTTSNLLAGDVWRVNFLRVQYELETVMNEDTNQLQYQKVADKREENLAWAPTGVMDIHRPEQWGFVFFSSENELLGAELELAGAMAGFLKERMEIERVLNAVYYKQRAFHATHGGYASTMEALYSDNQSNLQNIDNQAWLETFPLKGLLCRYELSIPTLTCHSVFLQKDTIINFHEAVSKDTPDRSTLVVTGRKGSRHYAPALDQHDEHFAVVATDIVKTIVPPPPPALSPRSQEIKNFEARGLYSNYVVTVRSPTQEWHMGQDARLWRTV